jgi:hypothetical protein
MYIGSAHFDTTSHSSDSLYIAISATRYVLLRSSTHGTEGAAHTSLLRCVLGRGRHTLLFAGIELRWIGTTLVVEKKRQMHNESRLLLIVSKSAHIPRLVGSYPLVEMCVGRGRCGPGGECGTYLVAEKGGDRYVADGYFGAAARPRDGRIVISNS